MKYIVVLLLLVCALHGVISDEEEESVQKVDAASLRLPTSLVPVHYLVQLQPFLSGNFSTEGNVEITFDVAQSTDKIVLHMLDIVTKNDTLKVTRIDNPETAIDIVNQEFDNKRQFYTATLGQQLEEGQTYIMHLEFSGYLNDNLHGFYRSSYKDADGNEIMLAATQFEATDARRAFPCFDEPAMKAKFTVEIARQEGMRTISNMPRAEELPYEGKEGWFWDKFNTTLPMSSYLVAFVVSDFAVVESEKHPDSDYFFRVWARKDAISQAEYAMAAGPNISRFYEEFFNVPFPLPKQDMVALPDFSAGAMENWGIITYREARLLMVPELTKAVDKLLIGHVIAHELAHMWFGDLVSPAWWTELWLNEGFASYVSYIGLNNFEPTMKILDQFVLNEVHTAFQLDSLESSHPISQKVNNPHEIDELFDKISYDKGASVLRMISSVLTEETFRKALSSYLTELSFKNAEQDDLWRYLTAQAHKDGTLGRDMTVKDIMDTWTLQMGYPVINVIQNGDGSVNVTQERFLQTKSSDEEESDANSLFNYKWWVPLTYTTSSKLDFTSSKPTDWLTNTEDQKILEGVTTDADKWVLFNVGQSGFYRVNYDLENWVALTKQLLEDHTAIGIINRAQIIDDSFNLAKAGRLDYKIPLNILSYLRNETEFVPLKAALNNVNFIRDMFSKHLGEDGLKQILKSIVVPLYEKIGFEDDLSSPHLEQRIRSSVVQVACQIGHQPCVDAAVDLYKKWMEDPSDASIISPNVKSTVLCTAIAAGTDEEWQFAWDQYQTVNVASEQPILLKALGCSKNKDTLLKFIKDSLKVSAVIRKQDTHSVFAALAENDEVGRLLVWDLVRQQWDDIVEFFGNPFYSMDKIIKSVTERLNTHDQLEQLKTFKNEHKKQLSDAKRSVEQSVETVNNNVNWMDSNAEVVENWIKETAQKQATNV